MLKDVLLEAVRRNIWLLWKRIVENYLEATNKHEFDKEKVRAGVDVLAKLVRPERILVGVLSFF